MDQSSLRSVAMTTLERRCSLLPREVVLLGCGNSGLHGRGGDYRGGDSTHFFKFSLHSSGVSEVSRITVSRLKGESIPKPVNPGGTGTGMDGRTSPGNRGGSTTQRGERGGGYILDSRCEAYCWIYLGNATTVNKNNKKDKGKTNVSYLYYC